MKNLFAGLFACLTLSFAIAQSPGDTIVIQAFDWSMTYGNAWDGTIRDTTVTFPDNQTISFEKVIMLYNIRCRDGNVNTTGGNSNACGEWDYSCNTYIHDSTHVDSSLSTHADYIITNFSGNNFYYSNTQLYDYIETYQPNVVLNSTTSEVSSTVGSGNISLGHTFPTDQNASKVQYLYTASELTGAGFATGTIDAIGFNVLSGSENANFLRILIKHTSASVLDPSNPELTGFDTVYYHNTSLVPGTNKIQFAQPFNWDGTSNVIIEFSFTNTIPGSNPVMIEGFASTDSSAMYNHQDYYISVARSEYINIPAGNLSSISNEITISFWANGNADVLPVNTSIVEGVDANNRRQVNIHFPWNNGRIYWDCGGNGSGGHDRIDKAAQPSEYEGTWNHWAFTKNANTGNMRIYLNGTLWHSGTGKTNPIDLQTLILAANKNLGNKWAGYIKEFRIFDSELAVADIQAWMNSRMDNTHPNFANLVAYYPMNEGSGTSINDNVIAQSANFTGNVNWMYKRGNTISNFFTPTNEKPNFEFFQGVYDITTTNDTISDSVAHTKYRVREFSVVPKFGTIEHDSIATVSDSLYCRSSNSKVYDEDGNLVRTISNGYDGTISPSTMDYFRRFPMRFEILSLVTPYGVNLDLGPDGETWVVDLSDFMPIMTGDKRITVERGGQWQEDMDIKFLFIVGTPPRDVLDVQQIWRNDSKGYQAIMADEAFEPRTLVLNPNAEAFKLRSVITGHGQEGEFIPQEHWLDVDGGVKEESWQVWTECSENPIYPQGGTWIYDRAGWCPGQPSDLKEVDITPFVTPGNSHTFDYGVTSATGTSNYIVNNQLVTYGGPNFTLDAAVVEIQAPTNYIEYKRTNPICAHPKVVIRNTGSTELTSLTIEYWINDDQTHQTYEWTGSLDFMQEQIVDLPSPAELWNGVAGMTTSKFHVTISAPNNGTDEYVHNNAIYSEFEIPEVLPADFTIRFKTNNIPGESKYELFDYYGNSIFVKDGMAANTTYDDTMSLPLGCYQLVITDTGDDGLSFWANNDGSGYAQIRNMAGFPIKYFNADFGGSLIYNFTIDFPLSYEEVMLNAGIELYPNPATTEFTLTGEKVDEAQIHVFNAMGQIMEVNTSKEYNQVTFDSSNLSPGIYMIHIDIKGRSFTKRVVIK